MPNCGKGGREEAGSEAWLITSIGWAVIYKIQIPAAQPRSTEPKDQGVEPSIPTTSPCAMSPGTMRDWFQKHPVCVESLRGNGAIFALTHTSLACFNPAPADLQQPIQRTSQVWGRYSVVWETTTRQTSVGVRHGRSFLPGYFSSALG